MRPARCKDCGYILEMTAEGAMYCPLCKSKRHRQPPEINQETGAWEGMYE